MLQALDPVISRASKNAYREGAGVVLQLFLQWLDVVGIHMRIAKHVHQLPWPQIAHLGMICNISYHAHTGILLHMVQP